MPTIDELYWDNRYRRGNTGWDIGKASSPISAYIDQLTSKEIKILIPGCGNAYEAEYLLQKGFNQIHLVDISESLVEKLSSKFEKEINSGRIQISKADFFEMSGNYDLIIEQTFYCAIDPSLREEYARKMHSLLQAKGKLVGLLFNYFFEEQGPPFGGEIEEYRNLFSRYFEIKTLDICHNSIKPRLGKEVFFIVQKA